MILVYILSPFQHLKVMISTARPLGQEVELERYESAVLPVMLDGHPLHIHGMGIGMLTTATKYLVLSTI